jgi:hypothetical protein
MIHLPRAALTGRRGLQDAVERAAEALEVSLQWVPFAEQIAAGREFSETLSSS